MESWERARELQAPQDGTRSEQEQARTTEKLGISERCPGKGWSATQTCRLQTMTVSTFAIFIEIVVLCECIKRRPWQMLSFEMSNFRLSFIRAFL